MLAALLALSLAQSADPIQRDEYGVPHILAASREEAFFHAGYAVAEDRLWQMENSRRVARGKMAEVFGASFENSDRDVLKFGYTGADLQKQYDALAPSAKQIFEAYGRGINAYIEKAKKDNFLPKGYSQNGFQPEPWTPIDSTAIAVRLYQLFGRRDPGEIRNWAFWLYLKGQSTAKDHALGIANDLLWLDDPASPTTVASDDDPLKTTHPVFPLPTRQQTEKQIAGLPNLGLFDLLPAIRFAETDERTRVAQSVAAPYKAGSYAVVVSKERSATGIPILLSAPQMGFTTPSIVHEMSISAPGIDAVGMDVPGVPGVVIGHTKSVAWALTSGVADTDDVFYFPADGSDGYRFESARHKFEIVTSTLKVKGKDPKTVDQQRTLWGPVLLSAKGTVLAQRSASYMKELQSMEAMYSLYDAKSPADLDRGLSRATVNFNFFYAFNTGQIGYRFLGAIPVRAAGIDPRFPVAGSSQNDWKGFLPFNQMPRVDNPKSGLLMNWNNKPVQWFTHGDAPVWGRHFRVLALKNALTMPKISVADVEMAAWRIARTEILQPMRTEYAFPDLNPMIRAALSGAAFSGIEADAANYLLAYDGHALDGSQGAEIFQGVVEALREELFQPTTGTIMSPMLFRIAIQGNALVRALEGKTNVNYLGERKRNDVVLSSFKKAVQRLQSTRGNDPALWRYWPGGIPVEGEPPIAYGNRGSYIQIVELRSIPRGRNVLPPGVSESGPHSKDQVPLSRAWLYKPMKLRD